MRIGYHYWMIFVAALAVRLSVLYELQDVNPISTGTDMLTYYRQALALLEGDWPQEGVFGMHPLMPLFIAFSFRIFGASSLSPQILNCIFGAIACPSLAVVGTKLFDQRVGLLAGWGLAVYQGSVFYSSIILDVPVTTLSLIAALWVLARPTYQSGILAGLCLFIGILGRGTLLITVISLAGWLLLTRRHAAAIAMVTTLVICLTPIIARNGYYGQIVISRNGPVNLWIGNNPDANGTYNIHKGGEAHQTSQQVQRSGGNYIDRVLEFIERSPLEWLRLTFRKSLMFVFLPDGFMPNNASLIFDGMANSWLLCILPGYWFFLILSLTGIIKLRARWSEFIPLAVVYFPYALVTILFFVLTRFRVPVSIVLILLSAVFAVTLFDEIRSYYRRYLSRIRQPL